MQKTYLTQSPLAELRYVIPVALLGIKSRREAATLHIAEHWWLEGAGQRTSSEELFRAARYLGGALDAFTSRKVIKLKLSYHAPLWKDAIDLIKQIITEAKFDQEQLRPMINDVVDELENDNEVTRLFGSTMTFFWAAMVGRGWHTETGTSL